MLVPIAKAADFAGRIGTDESRSGLSPSPHDLVPG